MTNDKAVNYEYGSLGRLIHSYQTEDDSTIQWTDHIYILEMLQKNDFMTLSLSNVRRCYDYYL